MVADSAGVVAAALRRGAHSDAPPSLLIHAMLDEELVPLAQALADLLREAEAYGRAVVDLWVLLGAEGRLSGQYHEPLSPDLHVSRDVTIPADEDEVRELALQWHRELQRTLGIPKLEGESEANE